MQGAYEDYLNATCERRKIPGLAVHIDKGSKTLINKGIGVAEPGRQVTPDTVFGIGSITKSFTALAVMQLCDAERLDVTDPILSYLPELDTPSKPQLQRVTLHHLLSNSAGIPPLPFLHHALARSLEKESVCGSWTLEQPDNLSPIDTTQELITTLREADFHFFAEPGEAFSYCNEGFALLGEVVARVSGQPYTTYVKTHILEPLGMTRSCFEIVELEALEDVTSLFTYQDGFDEVAHAPHWWEAPAMKAAGFLKSCTQDMQRYARLYCKPEEADIISRNAVSRMTTPHVRTSPHRHYGYGLMVQPDYQGYKLVEHGGNIKGVAAYLSMLPEAGLSGTILLNITNVPAGEMLLYGLNLALSLPPETPKENFKPTSLSAEALERFAGTYSSPEGMRLTITLTDQGLSTCVRDMRHPTQPVSAHQLLVHVNGQPELLEFRTHSTDTFSSVTYHHRILTKEADA